MLHKLFLDPCLFLEHLRLGAHDATGKSAQIQLTLYLRVSLEMRGHVDSRVLRRRYASLIGGCLGDLRSRVE